MVTKLTNVVEERTGMIIDIEKSTETEGMFRNFYCIIRYARFQII